MEHYSNFTVIVTGKNRRPIRKFLKSQKNSNISIKEKRGVIFDKYDMGFTLQSKFFIHLKGTPQTIENFSTALKQTVKFN